MREKEEVIVTVKRMRLPSVGVDDPLASEYDGARWKICAGVFLRLPHNPVRRKK